MFDKIGITQAPFLNVDIFLPTITKFECRFTSAILSNNIVSFFIKKSYVLINHKSFSQKKKNHKSDHVHVQYNNIHSN